MNFLLSLFNRLLYLRRGAYRYTTQVLDGVPAVVGGYVGTLKDVSLSGARIELPIMSKRIVVGSRVPVSMKNLDTGNFVAIMCYVVRIGHGEVTVEFCPKDMKYVQLEMLDFLFASIVVEEHKRRLL